MRLDNISFRKAEFWAHPVETAKWHCQGQFENPIEIWRYVSVEEMGKGTMTQVR